MHISNNVFGSRPIVVFLKYKSTDKIVDEGYRELLLKNYI